MSEQQIIIALEPSPGHLGEDFAARGVEVARLYNPDDVADVLASGQFDLCVIFAGDPRLAEVLRQLRATPSGAVMPVLLVGGRDSEVRERDAALDLGADAFVEAEVGLDELRERAGMLLGRPVTKSVPSIPTRDPVEDALAAAEAVAPAVGAHSVDAAPANVAAGASSVQEIIDRVEARVSAAPAAVTGTMTDTGDPLDALDIEADLGRPMRANTEQTAQVTQQLNDRKPPDSKSPPSEPVDVREAALDSDLEENDEPTMPGVPEEVTPAIEPTTATPADDDDDDDEITLVDPPAEEPLAELEIDSESVATTKATVKAEATSSVSATGTRLDRGNLKRDPLWALLARAHGDRVSGALVLTSRGIERKVFLDAGEPVMALSSAREDRLIELLYREGRLNEDQYQQAVMTIGASGRRAGLVLMEKGLISSRELFPLVRHHYETLIFDAFSWREGEWRFDSKQRAVGERIQLDISAGALIVEGIRLRATPTDIDSLILPGAMPLRAEQGICSLESIELPPEELDIFEACDGTKNTFELAQNHGLTEEDVRTLLAGLVVLGWIRPIGGDERAPRQAPPTVLAGTAAADARVERGRVVDKRAQIEEGTYFAIMEVSPEASGYEIRKAYRRLRGQFAPERFAVAELADLQPDVEVIRFVLDEAYEVLRNPPLREAYRQALGAGS